MAKGRFTGGRKKGSVNRKTLERIAAAERQVTAFTSKGKKLAIDHMDEMIDYFSRLVAVLVPWEPNGSPRDNKDKDLWFRAVAAYQGFLNMRAPYQSPRLSAIQMVPAQAQQRTTVNVTILNERGEKVYSDSDSGDDAKLIEHESGEAA